MWSHIFLFGILLIKGARPSEFTAILMFFFWREATAALVPGFLCQSGRRRPENVSILSSLSIYCDGCFWSTGWESIFFDLFWSVKLFIAAE